MGLTPESNRATLIEGENSHHLADQTTPCYAQVSYLSQGQRGSLNTPLLLNLVMDQNKGLEIIVQVFQEIFRT